MGSRDRGSSGSRVVRENKTNRNGTKNWSWGDIGNHVAYQSKPSFGFDKGGPSLSFSPDCGSCHDRVARSRSGNNHDRD